MASLLNATEQNISYVSKPGGSHAVVSFSSASSANLNNIDMLIDSATVSLSRGAQLKPFINAGPALLMGRGQGVVTVRGLFGTAQQMKDLLGSDPSKPCSLARNIVFKGGILESCNSSNSVKTGDVDLTLIDCVATNVNITISLQQGGELFQQADVAFLVTDAKIA